MCIRVRVETEMRIKNVAGMDNIDVIVEERIRYCKAEEQYRDKTRILRTIPE